LFEIKGESKPLERSYLIKQELNGNTTWTKGRVLDGIHPSGPNDQAPTVSVDKAEKGGIDLNTDKLDLAVKGDGSAAVKVFDPALFAQFQAAPGLIPVIIGIRPANDLPAFLGLSKAEEPVPSEALL
jgi:hypothetical protein